MIDPGTITSLININFHGTLTDVSIKINSLTHTFDGDLDIFLIGPGGQLVELTTDNGGGSDNYINTVFDQSALTLITASSAPLRVHFDLKAT